MSNVVELLRAGNLADLEVVLEVVDTQRLSLLAQWVLEALAALLVARAVSEVVSEEGSMVDVDEVASEEVFKIVEVMAEVEEVLVIKEVGGSKAGEVMEEEIAVGMVGRMAMALLQMPQLVQEVVAVDSAVDPAEEGMVLGLQIVLRQGVGMTRVVAVAHMMTETLDTVAVVEAMGIVMEGPGVEAAATWSR
jgi:hypothetical protein